MAGTMQDRTRPHRTTTSSVVVLLSLLALALALRTGAVLVRWERLSADPDAYRLIAENVAQRGAYSRSAADLPAAPTAFRPPVYPLLLATAARHKVVTPATVAVIHIATGTLTVLLVWILGQHWGLGWRSGLAAFLVAADPILLNQTAEVMTETLATLLGTLGLLAFTQWSARRTSGAGALAGAASGLAALCRPTFLIWAGLCGVYYVVTERNWKSVRQSAVFALALAITLLPWGERNLRLLGRPIVTTTHGGYTLLLANNPFFYWHLAHGAGGGVWDARELEPLLQTQPDGAAAPPAHAESEIDSDRRLYALAHQTIRQQPAMFLYSCLVRARWRIRSIPTNPAPRPRCAGRPRSGTAWCSSWLRSKPTDCAATCSVPPGHGARCASPSSRSSTPSTGRISGCARPSCRSSHCWRPTASDAIPPAAASRCPGAATRRGNKTLRPRSRRTTDGNGITRHEQGPRPQQGEAAPASPLGGLRLSCLTCVLAMLCASSVAFKAALRRSGDTSIILRLYFSEYPSRVVTAPES